MIRFCHVFRSALLSERSVLPLRLPVRYLPLSWKQRNSLLVKKQDEGRDDIAPLLYNSVLEVRRISRFLFQALCQRTIRDMALYSICKEKRRLPNTYGEGCAHGISRVSRRDFFLLYKHCIHKHCHAGQANISIRPATLSLRI